MYGLYKNTVASSYEGGCSSYESLLAVATNEQELVERWNKQCQASFEKTKHLHVSYANNLPKFRKGEKSIRYAGNTGGGYSCVRVSVTIKLIKQWDR